MALVSLVAKLVEEPPTRIVQFDPFEAQLVEFEEAYSTIVYDLSDPAQEKRARADRLLIGKVAARLDEAHKEGKAPHKALCDLWDNERRRIKDRLLIVQDKIKSQIAAHEKALQDAENELLMRIADIRALMVFDSMPSLEIIEARIATVKAVAVDHTFEHLINQAGLAKLQTLETLERLHANTKADIEAAAEKARLDIEKKAQEKREWEERVAALAVEDARIANEAAAAKAKRDADAAVERERKAKEKAQADAAEAEARAKREAARAAELADKAKADAVEAARREEREKAERAQAQQEQERIEREAREADEYHKAAIVKMLVDEIAKCGEISLTAAARIVGTIYAGDIPNIKIIY